MLKRIVFLVVFLLLASPVLASGFQLKYIGGLNTQGKALSEWWYSTENPALSGITTVGDMVTVTIDGIDNTASVDESGNWSYGPSMLTTGDHSVSVTGGAGSTSFTLHIGSDIPADVTAPSESEMPVAGAIENTMMLWLVGGLLIATGVLVVPSKSE